MNSEGDVPFRNFLLICPCALQTDPLFFCNSIRARVDIGIIALPRAGTGVEAF